MKKLFFYFILINKINLTTCDNGNNNLISFEETHYQD